MCISCCNVCNDTRRSRYIICKCTIASQTPVVSIYQWWKPNRNSLYIYIRIRFLTSQNFLLPKHVWEVEDLSKRMNFILINIAKTTSYVNWHASILTIRLKCFSSYIGSTVNDSTYKISQEERKGLFKNETKNILMHLRHTMKINFSSSSHLQLEIRWRWFDEKTK